jgi:hypothetical protein
MPDRHPSDPTATGRVFVKSTPGSTFRNFLHDPHDPQRVVDFEPVSANAYAARGAAS